MVLADGSSWRSRPPRTRRTSPPPGSASGRSGSSTRSRSGPCLPSPSTASTVPARWTRRSPSSTGSTPPATTSSSTSSPTPRRRSAARAGAPASRRARALGAAVYAQEVMLENWVGQAVCARGPPFPLPGPAPHRASRPPGPGARPRSTAATGSSPPSVGSGSRRWSTGSRASTRRRRSAGCCGWRRAPSIGSPIRSRSASSRPTTSSSAPPTNARSVTSPCTRTASSIGSRTFARLRRSWTPTAVARTGASATSRPPRRSPRAIRAGASSRPCGRGWIPSGGSPTPTPSGVSRARSQPAAQRNALPSPR